MMKLLLLVLLFFILSHCHSKYFLIETYNDSIDAGKQGESTSLRDDDKTDKSTTTDRLESSLKIEEEKKWKIHTTDLEGKKFGWGQGPDGDWDHCRRWDRRCKRRHR